MTLKKRRIGLVALGEVPEIALKVIAAHISGYFNLSAQILPSLKLPEYAFDQKRLQYNAGIILTDLETVHFSKYEKIIGVSNLDLFVPIFEYVFGEARQGEKFALISLFRLNKNPDGSSLSPFAVYERAAKVALHELGHLYDLFHCDDKKCLMHFSGGLDDLDKTSLYLCRFCSANLAYNISR
jgi:archaemetzincin